MSREGFAEAARSYLTGEIEKARSEKSEFATFRAETVREPVREIFGQESCYDIQDICQVLRTAIFADKARVEPMADSGGERRDTTFRFKILY